MNFHEKMSFCIHHDWGFFSKKGNRHHLFQQITDPFTNIAFFYFLYMVTGRLERFEESPFFFLCSGFMVFMIFKEAIMGCIKSINRYKNTVAKESPKPIEPIFIMVGTIFRQSLFGATTFIILILFGLLINYITLSWSGMAAILLAITLLMFLGLGIGLFFATVTRRASWVSKILSLLIRPLFFGSTLFYPLSIVPSAYQHYFLYNPIVHAISMVREAMFNHYAYHDIGYLLWCSIISMVVGLFTYFGLQHFYSR